MTTTKYPFRDALYIAHTIYRDAMRGFIIRCLKKHPDATVEELIKKVLKECNSHKEIEATIDINDFPEIVRKYWKYKCDNTQKVYDIFRQEFNSDGDIRSEIEFIKNGRLHWAHPGTKDSNSEEIRTLLHHIVTVLDKINELSAKCEVEIIRDRLFSHEGKAHLEVVSNQLETAEGAIPDEHHKCQFKKQ